MKKSRDEEKAFARYQQIISLLNEVGDREGIALIQDLVKKCVNYFEVIRILSSSQGLKSLRKSLDQLSESRLSAAENLRSDKHNEAISQLEKVNKYLFRKYGVGDGKIPIGGICSLDPDSLFRRDRTAIADWIMYLVNALVKEGIVVVTKE